MYIVFMSDYQKKRFTYAADLTDRLQQVSEISSSFGDAEVVCAQADYCCTPTQWVTAAQWHQHASKCNVQTESEAMIQEKHTCGYSRFLNQEYHQTHASICSARRRVGVILRVREWCGETREPGRERHTHTHRAAHQADTPGRHTRLTYIIR